MLIGITGDTHNNLKNISKICDLFNSYNVDLVIHTGDITLPKSLMAFSKLKTSFIGVLGNNDEEEKDELQKLAKKLKFKIFNEPHSFTLDDIKIFIFHHPHLIKKYHIEEANVIFHGHTHRYRNELIDKTLIFNPGECAGIMEGKNNIGLYETEKKEVKIISF